jgi:hypothetical protein
MIDTITSAPTTAQLTVLIFDCAVAVVSLGILLFFFVARADDSPSAFHQNLAIGIFSVAVTSIAVLLGLMLPDQNAVNSISGKVGLVSFYIAGPTAIWIVVFKITAQAFGAKATTIADRNTQVFNENLEHHYQGLGFTYYRNWIVGLDSSRRVIEKSELHFIDDLLPKVFYHGPYDLLKPQNVINTTLFFFTKKGAVKFQRIQGVAQAVGDRRPRVYLPQTSSTPQGHTSCLHFIRNGNRINQTACHSHGEWKVAPLNNIDILLMAVYENDEIDVGDYVYVDISKYVDLGGMDDAAVNLAIVSDRRIEEFNVWEVSASLASTEKPVPLMFRNLDSQTVKRTAAEVGKNIEQIPKMFEGWDTIIDQAMSGTLGQTVNVSEEEVEKFLRKVKDILANCTLDSGTTSFHDLFHRPSADDCVVSKLKHQRNVILSTFAWG